MLNKLLFFSFSFLVFLNYAQNNISGNNKIVNDLNALGKERLLKCDFENSIKPSLKALKLSKKTNYRMGILLASKNIGVANKMLGNNEVAREYLTNALKISKNIKDKKLEAEILRSIGLIFESEDRYEEALKLFLESLAISEKINDTNGIANCYNVIGIIYSNQSNYKKALHYYNKSLLIRKKEKDLTGMSDLYNNIGIVYMDQYKLDLAILMNFNSIKIEKKQLNKNGLALSYNNLGLCYRLSKNNLEALNFHKKSMTLNLEMKNRRGISLASFNIGADYYNLKEYDSARYYGDIAFTLSNKIHNLYIKQSACHLLSEIYEKQFNFEKSLLYERLNSEINDSIYDLESQKNMADMESKYETIKKDKELIKLVKEKEVNQLQIEKQNIEKYQLYIIILTFILIISVLVILTIFVRKTNRKLNLSNHILNKKNLEIEEKKEEINLLAIQIVKYKTQMNPHFIFNAINGLQGVILEDDKFKAIHQIQEFSKLMRLTLNNSENEYITIEDEIDYLTRYVTFELYNFSQKFKFEINVDLSIDLKTCIPSMLIQPIIENAIRHAELDKIINGLIQVNVKVLLIDDIKFIEISIVDNGRGIDETVSTSDSKGIKITKERIKLELKKQNHVVQDFFYIASPLKILGPNYGTMVVIIIPLN